MRFACYWTSLLSLIILAVAACGEAEPTPVPTPSSTTTPTLTPEPTPTDVPTSQSTSPSDLSPQEIIESALAAHGRTETFHFELEGVVRTTIAGVTIEGGASVSGDFEPPDRVRARSSSSFGLTSFEVDVIRFGLDFYITDPETGEWVVVVEDDIPPPANPIDFVAILRPAPQSIMLVGQESIGAVEVYHLQGLSDLAGAFEAGASGSQAPVDFWIGVEDLRIYRVQIEGEVPAQLLDSRIPPGTITGAELSATMTFSDFGKSVTVEAPALSESP